MSAQDLSDRLLHRFALDSRSLQRFWFRRECERNGFAADPRRQNLFIAGVARAGSTALLNAIYRGGAFASATYAAMPFVLAPSLARRLSSLPRRGIAVAERAHGDGIEVGLDSPEALDALFWRVFCPAPAGPVEAREVPRDVLEAYAMFIENLLRDAGAVRYLAKMNQGIDKIESLARFFERSVFLLPFRDPLQQAASLMRQHRRFSDLRGYQRRYFGWLEHYEFGALHRPFGFGGSPAASDPGPDDLNYWLRQWHDGYAYLSGLAELYPNLFPVCYEHMARSESFWEVLSQRLDAEISAADFFDRNRDDLTGNGTVDDGLLRECRALYARLQQQALAGSET